MVDVQAWMDHVLTTVGGGEVVKPVGPANSTKGGKVLVAAIKADPDKGKFPLKDKDSSMAAAFAFLRSKGAFPEDNDSDDDDLEEACPARASRWAPRTRRAYRRTSNARPSCA